MATTPIALFAGSLVGDVIVQARETVPDMPSSLHTPVFVSAVGATIGGGTITPTTYYLVVSALNQWGESLASNEIVVAMAGGQNAITINVSLTTGVTAVRLYLGGLGSGLEDAYITILPTSNVNFNVLSFASVLPGSPPTRSTAWLPDTDGGFISASAIYRWLNAGMELIARNTGGFQDYSAIGSTINQPLYQIPGTWNAITAIWYDGYWMEGGDPGYFWRRNSITSQVLSKAHISVNAGRAILEVYPQPARTSISTTLVGSLSATATSCTLTNGAFTLPFGFASIGSEIVAYATISGNTLTGLIRGLGGTSAIAHVDGETVVECNIAWMGKRQSSQQFSPGQSLAILPISSGWDQLLVQYIAGRAKIVEHDMQSMSAFQQDMEKQIKAWSNVNRGVVRRRQVGGPGASPLVYYPTPGGGLIVP